MRAIIHSIHSQVPATVAELGRGLDVVSMDSHLDVWVGGDDDVYPERLRLVVARTGAHWAIRQATGGRRRRRGGGAPRVVVAIPEAMLLRHAMDVESRLPRSLRVADEEEAMSSAVDYLTEDMGIEVFRSPPKPLRGLATQMAENDDGPWLLDVDVDYMQEMQKECYTRIVDPAPGVLQTVDRVLEFVRRSRPETITISEAKVAAIRDVGSAFSAFVGELRAEGYLIEERGVFESDAEVVAAISVCREFYRKVSSKLVVEHMDEMMGGDMDGFRKAEAAAAKGFFRERGYG